jgi:hypothetical protein
VGENNSFGYISPIETGNFAIDSLSSLDAFLHNRAADFGNAGLALINAGPILTSAFTGRSLAQTEQDWFAASMGAGGPFGPEVAMALSTRYSLRQLGKAFDSVANNVIHKNSLEYVGDTHVYRIVGPDGATYKIGESAQGARVSDGASIRAEQQVRALQRESGDVYKSEILQNFPDKASARQYETQLIERFRRIYGESALPGNKTNR